ncbi:alpha/beta hydrolase [Pseudomonas sp. S09G 359]|uniref:alpha/beta hydrolase n=1 Tax=Pseudomonas sp. S09G 359 TaxID=2054919 RepID=UPI000C6EC73D|nr:alpha/beta hydrolase [Pseudomonas sp. S09G 359]AUG07232.1 alpha/beta hydrolase [Pseudomonas sp. S09G 359]
MSVHPDLSAFLELAEFGRLTGKSQPLHALPLAQGRSDFERTSQILDPNPPGDIEVRPVQLPTRDGAMLQGRLYRLASTAAQVLPTILYFHGGGYVVGSLDSHDSVCRRLALSGEFAVLAPAYRLAPEYPFPTAVHDALDSVSALQAQAEHLHLDPHRLVVAGDSAGATLAAVLAITAANHPADIALTPVAQLLFYPVTDMTTERASHRTYAEGYLLESETLEWFYQHYGDTAARQDWRASPLQASLVEAQAPAYVSLAEYDPLFDEGVAYAEALAQGETPVTLTVERGLSHDFLRMGGIVASVDDIYRRALDWAVAAAR